MKGGLGLRIVTVAMHASGEASAWSSGDRG
jgi:hypothetical protein